MKKTSILISLLTLLITSCSHEYKEVSVPVSSNYVDWDRAIRIDTDMQTMYAATPTKINRPIDMYMAFALALKYNYTRRLTSYKQSMIEMGINPKDRLPEVFSSAGYVNTENRTAMDSELKLAWNILDVSAVYYQSTDKTYQANIAYEQSRKVIHNLLQETRTLYWKALSAQRALPLINDMIEYMSLDVDEINSRAAELAKEGKSLRVEDLSKKRRFMSAIKELYALKSDLETSNVRLASLMGFHPSTDFKLAGKEYGNYELPEIKSSLKEMEWIALNNRPELRSRDYVTSIDEIVSSFRVLTNPGNEKYLNDSNYYNRLWSKKAQEIGLDVFENVKNPQYNEAESLRRQRMTNLILTQVYVAWARYMSAMEDYQIAFDLSRASEDIAEDAVMSSGARSLDAQLESIQAIEDETKAMLAYVDLQDALGNLYSTLGMDAIPYYMLNEKPSQIAIYLRGVLEKWRKGDFLPDNRPYLLEVPTKRPPVNLSSPALMPDLDLESGQRFEVIIPQKVFKKMNFNENDKNVVVKAGLLDDSPLPEWILYDDKNRKFVGQAMPGSVGSYTIKAYLTDNTGKTGYITFKIKIKDVYVPSVKVKGLNAGREALVLKRCIGPQCTDEYIADTVIGEDVQKTAY